MLPPRPFVLSNTIGWIANIVRLILYLLEIPEMFFTKFLFLKVSLCYIALTTVLFLFPPELPVTGSNMSKFSPFSSSSVKFEP